MDRLGSPKMQVAVGALLPGIAAAVLLWLATTRWGVNYTPDSVHYLAAARSLLAGKGFLNAAGEPYAIWPPLYPLVLAAGQAVGANVLDWVRVLNALLLVALAPLTALLCYSASRWRLASIAAGALVAFLPATFISFGHAWSDPLFAVLAVAAGVAVTHYFERRTLSAAALVGMFVALACLQRYVGVALVAAFGLAILLVDDRRFTERLKPALVFGLVSVAPLGAWMVRNRLVVGAAAGERAAPSFTLAENIELLARSWISTFFLKTVSPAAAPPGPAVPLAYAVTLGAVTLVVLVVAVWRVRAVLADSERRGTIALSALVLVVYAVLLLAIASASGTEISDRILAPLVPFWLALALGVLSFVPLTTPDRRRILAISLALVLVLMTGAYGLRTVAKARAWRRSGVERGFNQKSWLRSPTYLWLLANADGKPVYSNVPATALDLMSRGRLDARPLVIREDDAAVVEPGYFAFFKRYVRPTGLQAPPAFAPPVGATESIELPDGLVQRLEE